MPIMICTMTHDAKAYCHALSLVGLSYLVTVDTSYISKCEGLLLPGGGDIAPILYGSQNKNCKSIHMEEDLRQIFIFYEFLQKGKPILGICKGLQLINIALGGTLIQHLPTHSYHEYCNKDQYHETKTLPGSILHQLYDKEQLTNSAHHQGIATLGKDLTATQYAKDGVIEGIESAHNAILGLQWHPERLLSPNIPTGCVDGLQIFRYFRSLIS